ncbi:unnamed protein product [Spirodela intermedia]|uniref:Uncharacterized protein n=1 Tax=Spirodela intermedia TaxID=51605 RepID=A0A7I8LCX4_SPIIN|nr:unnamed protein product [Spirodela intermedia]
MICSRGGFPQLQHLVLDSLENLKRWVAVAGTMPRLRSLKIYGCRKLALLPEGLQHMTALKDLTLLNRNCRPAPLADRRRTVHWDGQEEEQLNGPRMTTKP